MTERNKIKVAVFILMISIVFVVVMPHLVLFVVATNAIIFARLWKHPLCLPIISLAICLMPAFIWGCSAFFEILNIEFMVEIFIWMIFGSFLGNLFYILATIFSAIYIVKQISFAVSKKTENINVIGIALSVVSISLASIFMYIFIPIFLRGA